MIPVSIHKSDLGVLSDSEQAIITESTYMMTTANCPPPRHFPSLSEQAVLRSLGNAGLLAAMQEARTKWSHFAPFVAPQGCPADIQLHIDRVNVEVHIEYETKTGRRADPQLPLALDSQPAAA